MTTNRNTLTSWLPRPSGRKVRDASGHEHASDGRFGSGGSSAGSSSADTGGSGDSGRGESGSAAGADSKYPAEKAKGLYAKTKKLLSKAKPHVKKAFKKGLAHVKAAVTDPTSTLYQLSYVALKHGLAAEIVDNQEDWNKGAALLSGTYDLHGHANDPFRAATGGIINAGMVMNLASTLIVKGIGLIHGKKGGKKGATPKMSTARKAKIVAKLYGEVLKAMGSGATVDVKKLQAAMEKSDKGGKDKPAGDKDKPKPKPPEKRASAVEVKTIELPAGMQTKDQLGIKPKFDDAKMSVTAVLSTPALDRDWEIMSPAGCDLTDYAAGPAPWFFNHQAIPFPIGSAKERATERDCPLDVKVESDHVWGKCHFNQATKEAEIIYALWKIGHLGATSIGFQGGKYSDIEGQKAVEMGAPYRVRIWETWKMVENSIVGVGANPEALRMHASRGHVEKIAIPDTLKKWFGQFIVPTKFLTAGAQLPPERGQSPVTTNHKRSTVTPKGRKMADDTTSHGETVKVPGHALIEGIAGKVKEMMDGAHEGLASTELEDVKGDVMRFLKGAHEGITNLCEAHGDKYEGLAAPELPDGMDFSGVSDKADDDIETEGGDDDDDLEIDDTDDADETDDEEKDDDITDDEEKAYAAMITKLEGRIDEQSKLLAAAK